MLSKIFFMSKEDNWFTTLLKIGAVIGGAWIAIETIKAFSKPKTVYSCPNCNTDIEYGIKECNNCHVSLSWEMEVKK